MICEKPRINTNKETIANNKFVWFVVKKIPSLLAIIIITLSFLSSCGTLSTTATQQAPEKPKPEKPMQAESPQTIEPHWQQFDREAGEAIALFEGKILKPRLELWAVRIDLSAPHIKIFTAAGNPESRGASILSTYVTSFVRDNNLLAGINALPFDPVSGKEGEYRGNVGIVISDGYILSPPHSSFSALVFYDDAPPAIIPQSKIVSAVNIAHAVGGFYQILADGALSAHTENSAERHPRSAAGISADGRYLYLLAIDGRRLGSVGSTEAETAEILRQLGAWNGINLDGGGSTSLALRFPDGKVRPVNKPIHNNIPGTERGVAGCIGVGLKY